MTGLQGSNKKEVILKADKELFGQMILVAESKQLHMDDVLVHPLGPLPWALANNNQQGSSCQGVG